MCECCKCCYKKNKCTIEQVFQNQSAKCKLEIHEKEESVYLELCGDFSLAWSIKRMLGLGYTVEDIWHNGCKTQMWFKTCPTKYYS